MKLFYSQEYVSAAHAFDTTRKASSIAASLIRDPIAGIDLAKPEPVSGAQLLEIHEAGYIDAVRTGSPAFLAESQGFPWDAGIWEAVRASTGGVIAAARQALSDGVAGTLSSGLHHATAGSGAGFCTFNGLALAARAAHGDTGGRVLILDLDAHCGGGTHEIVGCLPWVRCLDVAVNPFDAYRPAGDNTLDLVSDPARYLETVERRLAECGKDYALCLYNAGMDPFGGGGFGGLRGITREILARREALVLAWCRDNGIPAAFTIAGGYTGLGLDLDGLVSLHRLTIAAAAGR